MTDRAPEEDIYFRGAARAFEVPLSEVTRAQRQTFKEQFFSFLYNPLHRGASKESIVELIDQVADALKATWRTAR